MEPTVDLRAGMEFLVLCVLFCGAGVYLFLQTVDKSLTIEAAALIYAPLLLCWIGIGLTLNGKMAWIAAILVILALIWGIMVRIKIVNDDHHAVQSLRDEHIQKWRDWIASHPSDIPIRFKLAEAYEDSGRFRDAYEQYASSLTVDPLNARAQLRARKLYEQITGSPMPGGENAYLPELPDDGGVSTNVTQRVPVRTPVRPPDRVAAAAATRPPATRTAPPAPAKDEPRRIAELKSSIVDEPARASLYAALGEEYLRLGRMSEACGAYKSAVRLDPSNDQYRANLYSLPDDSCGV